MQRGNVCFPPRRLCSELLEPEHAGILSVSREDWAGVLAHFRKQKWWYWSDECSISPVYRFGLISTKGFRAGLKNDAVNLWWHGSRRVLAVCAEAKFQHSSAPSCRCSYPRHPATFHSSFISQLQYWAKVVSWSLLASVFQKHTDLKASVSFHTCVISTEWCWKANRTCSTGLQEELGYWGFLGNRDCAPSHGAAGASGWGCRHCVLMARHHAPHPSSVLQAAVPAPCKLKS